MEGSKVISLVLTTAGLLVQMKEHSYYIGESLKSNPQIMELAAKIQASDDDNPVLQDFAQQGGTKLGNILSRVVGKTSYAWDEGKTNLTFTVNAVANFMDSQKDMLKDSMLGYLSCYVLSKWLNLIKPDESVRFEALLTQYEEDMRQLGAQRDKPIRL